MKKRLGFFKKRDGLDFKRRRNGRDTSGIKKGIILSLEVAGVVALGVFLAFFFFSGVTVSGPGMEPTLSSGNRVLVNRITTFVSPKVGEVVAFESGGSSSESISVKRVVAVPGDSVLIKNGILYVNGEREESKLELEPMDDFGLARNEMVLGEREYFLLGDNRNNSEDSRYQSVGPVDRSEIIGIIWACYSTENFGLVD